MFCIQEFWMVVSNMFYFHPEPWGNYPIWREIFFKRVGSTINQRLYYSMFHCIWITTSHYNDPKKPSDQSSRLVWLYIGDEILPYIYIYFILYIYIDLIAMNSWTNQYFMFHVIAGFLLNVSHLGPFWGSSSWSQCCSFWCFSSTVAQHYKVSGDYRLRTQPIVNLYTFGKYIFCRERMHQYY